MRSFVNSATAALTATSCSIVIVDATRHDYPIAFVNTAFCSMSGYSAEESIGRNCRFLQGIDTDPVVVAEIGAAVAAGISIRRDILNYRKDGSSFWNDLTIDPIRDADGQLTGFIGTQHGSDAVHLARQEKAEAEARLDSIANHVPGYIYRRLMRPDGAIEIAYCSPSLSKTLGVSEAEIRESFYEFMHRDDRETVIEAVRSSAANMSLFREELGLLRPAGKRTGFAATRRPGAWRTAMSFGTVWPSRSAPRRDGMVKLPTSRRMTRLRAC